MNSPWTVRNMVYSGHFRCYPSQEPDPFVKVSILLSHSEKLPYQVEFVPIILTVASCVTIATVYIWEQAKGYLAQNWSISHLAPLIEKQNYHTFLTTITLPTRSQASISSALHTNQSLSKNNADSRPWPIVFVLIDHCIYFHSKLCLGSLHSNTSKTTRKSSYTATVHTRRVRK